MKHPVYYLPAIHRKAAPDAVPADVLFFADILEAATPAPEGARALPFGPAEGRALVRDLLAMGDALGAVGNLRGALAVDSRRESVYAIDAEEEADIAAFAVSGEAPAQGAGSGLRDGGNEERLLAGLESAQKVLLLAGAREEAVLEALGLEARFRGASDALMQSLGEGVQDDDSLPNPLQWAQAENSGTQAVDWRALFEAAFAFMPEGALIMTADETLGKDLAEQGLLGEVPGRLADDCTKLFPQGVRCTGYLELPGWRLTGRTALPADKPWLASSRTLLVFENQSPESTGQ